MSTASNALKTVLFTLLVPLMVAVAIPQNMAASRGASLLRSWAWQVPGWTLVMLGGAGYLWCARLFVKAQGTPAPVSPTRLPVLGGPYRVLRNPMYLSVLAVVCGQAVLYRMWALLLYGALLALIFHLFVLWYEEPNLRTRFDGEYEDFCRRVPRWLPRWRR